MGNLYVADFTNSRVLEYNTPLNPGSGETGAGDTTADMVFGQGGNFTSNRCNLGGRSASSMCVPMGITVDNAGNLYIADGFNNRVLEYNTPRTTDTIADRVFGTCGSFTSFACVGVSADSLKNPTGVAVDNLGNLYVADNQNNRVLGVQHAAGDCHADRVVNVDRDSDCNSDGDANVDWNCDVDEDCDCDCDLNVIYDSHGDRNCYADGHLHSHADRYAICNANVHSDTRSGTYRGQSEGD